MGSIKTKLITQYIKKNLTFKIFLSLILGAILGAIFQNSQTMIYILTPLGDIFIRLLKMIVMPVVICTIVSSTSSLSPSLVGRVGIKIGCYYILTSFFAIIIGLGVGKILSPGFGLELDENAAIIDQALNLNISDIVFKFIPTNPFYSISNGELIPTIVFCIFFGLSLAFSKESSDIRISKLAKMIVHFFEVMCDVMYRIIGWILQYAPIGVFALIFITFSKNGAKAFGPLASITISIYLALFFQVIFVYFIACLIFKINPILFLKKAKKVIITAFVTRSSSATIPLSMKTLEKQMGVSRKISGFTLPLGSNLNMDGTTIYIGVCAILMANISGITLNFNTSLTIVIISLLAAIGTAGAPGVGSIMLLMVLESIGLKMEENSVTAIVYGMVLGADAILDSGRTCINVVGDLVGSLIIAKSENSVDNQKWKI